MLFPAAVLVFVVLGAIAVDFALVFLGERQVANAAAAAANDAATRGLDLDRFYADGTLVLRPDLAADVARSSVQAGTSSGLVIDPPEVLAGGTVVEVRVTGRVKSVFAKALPGGRAWTEVSATAAATAANR